MLLISGYELLFEGYVIFKGGFSGPGSFTLSFVFHVIMIVNAIMGLKFREDQEKQKILAGISGMQTLFSLVSIVASHMFLLSFTLETVSIDEWLGLGISVVLLVLYTISALKAKKERDHIDTDK